MFILLSGLFKAVSESALRINASFFCGWMIDFSAMRHSVRSLPVQKSAEDQKPATTKEMAR